MIQLVRARDAKSVVASFRGTKHAARCARLLDDFYLRHGNFDSKYWKAAGWKSTKKRLIAESRGKCAYCEATTTTVAHGDVEHFRPKSVYWWLAFAYDNYLFACQICNQTHKGDQFPVTGPRLRAPAPARRPAAARFDAIASALAPDPTDKKAVARFLKRIRKENAHLIDPYLVDPTTLLAWQVNDVRKEVRVVARGKTARARRAVDAAEQVLGLNREELARTRYTLYQELKTARDIAAKLPMKLRKDMQGFFRPKVAADAEYAAMARYFVVEKWKLLPSL